ncbi:MAG: class 1 fructose-bisphosphatase [Saprospiraceae bacterium]|jgi:fructose-1,6-bisphosphatase I|nr:class 1 fructose-bisphosphatase [Saprospiraceae bacterium]MBK7795107.1 class 1 fructose-bisphosphatase [Saprospiraceae bacterium]MBK9376783.1 class 1 fructose-bisphosphatase [Saprospiraceae bacterium]MBL0262004.1 class 1 fructose-bisphosphatase [Saprospiraceae bacterium]MBX7162055.1 class 1 fructose-bisphosphatase [Saprospiraceae bacterium]
MSRRITLDEFIIQNEQMFPLSTGEFSGLLRHIGIAAKIVNRIVNKAGLMDVFGIEGTVNTSGDTVQKLDIYTNELMIEYLRNSGLCAGVASEELDEYISFPAVKSSPHKYIVVMDPLDGSSNIDVNISVGTIFGIYERISPVGSPAVWGDFLQKGTHLIAAGYVLYGTSTMFVFTTGMGVNGFTYDRGIGEFCLSHPQMAMPEDGPYYSVNQSYYSDFTNEIKNFISYCVDQKKMLRYIGSMVADIHRTICLGGVFMYPSTSKNISGKLRMLYECNPLSFIVEQAGGVSINEQNERILDIEISELHQRSPIIIGSKKLVDKAASFR